MKELSPVVPARWTVAEAVAALPRLTASVMEKGNITPVFQFQGPAPLLVGELIHSTPVPVVESI
ncbi:MAG: hypothetical protein UV06_C0010G0002 [Candidatus Collierbacteria bacterium GW2011_GWA2_42_17]|uniref:Uncharacterized protein n=1 Tax=Candidatus Collierbacteria bacterium GW2011_GWA2_42_17 TaxID=1618378 RepID=A0A0G0Z162_9BACT|nr:MAG: hypothetical protein UV06_C0010G0002 [Candidatus Collierbacteria bacterium GW2011_GWA2_42_17]